MLLKGGEAWKYIVRIVSGLLKQKDILESIYLGVNGIMNTQQMEWLNEMMPIILNVSNMKETETATGVILARNEINSIKDFLPSKEDTEVWNRLKNVKASIT